MWQRTLISIEEPLNIDIEMVIKDDNKSYCFVDEIDAYSIREKMTSLISNKANEDNY